MQSGLLQQSNSGAHSCAVTVLHIYKDMSSDVVVVEGPGGGGEYQQQLDQPVAEEISGGPLGVFLLN